MLIEFDMLFAVFALMLVLPVTVFQIVSNQSAFVGSSTLFSNSLILNSGTQKLVSQLGEMVAQTGFDYGLGNSGYSLTPYNTKGTQNSTCSRLAVAGGSVYCLSVRK